MIDFSHNFELIDKVLRELLVVFHLLLLQQLDSDFLPCEFMLPQFDLA
jgi:hypothetical protein